MGFDDAAVERHVPRLHRVRRHPLHAPFEVEHLRHLGPRTFLRGPRHVLKEVAHHPGAVGHLVVKNPLRVTLETKERRGLVPTPNKFLEYVDVFRTGRVVVVPRLLPGARAVAVLEYGVDHLRVRRDDGRAFAGAVPHQPVVIRRPRLRPKLRQHVRRDDLADVRRRQHEVLPAPRDDVRREGRLQLRHPILSSRNRRTLAVRKVDSVPLKLRAEQTRHAIPLLRPLTGSHLPGSVTQRLVQIHVRVERLNVPGKCREGDVGRLSKLYRGVHRPTQFGGIDDTAHGVGYGVQLVENVRASEGREAGADVVAGRQGLLCEAREVGGDVQAGEGKEPRAAAAVDGRSRGTGVGNTTAGGMAEAEGEIV
mmetsp:Transcript_27202/g.54411  ORF Transcript_27202/g.54411 Transcript_27202/m.54411 type:complete len:366 (-) Transcript_27202:158-1255(-)